MMNSRKEKCGSTLAPPGRMMKKRAMRLLVEFANLRLDQLGQIHSFMDRWERWFVWDPAQMQDDMRDIWGGKLTGKHAAERVVWWLRLGDRQPWEWAKLHPEDYLDGPPILVDWDTGQIVPMPQTLDEHLWTALLQNSKKLAFCKNRDCTHPFFLRYRPGQRFCSEKCALPAQRDFKRRWWNEYGKQWRASRGK
jgi:hypothetical protein